MSQIQESGAISERRGDIAEQEEAFAERYYNQLKNSKRANIIQKMVQSSSLPEKTVKEALEHILDNEYLLWDWEQMVYRMRTFYPEHGMAKSLQRLHTGTPTPTDIMMLQHESLESYYMAKYNLPYDEAHKLANKKYNYEEATKNGKN